MSQIAITRLLAAFFMLSVLNPAWAYDNFVKKFVREELAKTSAATLPLTFNGHFYILGESKYDHEQNTAVKYADWVKTHEGKQFLFIPGVESMQMPGFDGTLFDADATRPVKRVSFKIRHLERDPPVQLGFTILDAALKTREYTDFNKALKIIFPSETRLKGWQSRINMMSAMGFKRQASIPDVVVVDLEPAQSDEEMKSLILSLKEFLDSKTRRPPDQIILFSQDRAYELNKRVDYGNCNSEF
jgi:hypothetical protein